MQISVFGSKKVLSINDELAKDYGSLRHPIDTKTAELLLAADGINKDTSLSEKELSSQLESDMREEIGVAIDMTVGGKAKEAFEIAGSDVK